MALIVHKYGGTSVGDPERIRSVAERVARVKRAGNDVVAVVSAMAGETDRLLQLAHKVSADPIPQHQDLLVSTGEQVTVGLLSLALESLGLASRGFLGSQVRIVTDERHGKARIKRIDAGRIRDALKKGEVAIIAGFQGVTEQGAITTIGRGGSDTSAVAIAAALKADVCEIFTDVAGVYTADPRIVEGARLLRRMTYEEMLELADSGAKVLHNRSVEIAARFRVPLVVRSSFDDGEGTEIVPEEESMEETLVSGISLDRKEAKVAIRHVPDRVDMPARIFRPLAEGDINVDMILMNVSKEGHTDVSFTVPKDDLKRAITIAEGVARELGAGKVEASADIAKIAVVGLGMRSHAGVAHTMFSALAKEGVGIQMISTSEIKVAMVIDIKYAELAVRILHDTFELGKGET
ncbi:MAG: aspartate kinase [Deltaproteobacteria bacterium]|nr:aspartate kinase [Deltaproteobacteria bacterium]